MRARTSNLETPLGGFAFAKNGGTFLFTRVEIVFAPSVSVAAAVLVCVCGIAEGIHG